MEARRALRSWVVRRGNTTEEELGDDSGLVADGLINSLDIFDLIAQLETLRGAALDMQALSGDEFRSINSLIKAFFKEPA
ncbi:MAG TPA: acyl carrier protein [bacterium]|nr:acyl carrier protein [bacterium]